MKKFLIFVSLSLSLFSACTFESTEVKSDVTQPSHISTNFTPPTGTGAYVIKVSDGDTIKITLNGKPETVRLIGVDTPETVDPRKPIQCFGMEASNKTKELVEHQQVRLESDPTQADRDKYGRLLRYVFLSNGEMLNEILIRDGYGFEYTYKVPYLKQKKFKAAEKDAKENKKGLWSDTTCAGVHK